MYVILADRYGWTPQQVADLDPDFLRELMAYIAAKGDVEKQVKKRTRRPGVESVDISEIR